MRSQMLPASQDKRPMFSLIFTLSPRLSAPTRPSHGTDFFLSALCPNKQSGTREMSTRSHYLKKANTCADAAKTARDPAERVALLQVSQCFILLADYVAARQEHGTAHRGDEQRAMPPDS